MTDAPKAVISLEQAGVAAAAAADLVRRYGRDAKRLNIDLKHTRQAKFLALRQQLELELMDVADSDIGQEVIDRSLEHLIPRSSDLTAALAPAARALPVEGGSTVAINVNQTINQQIVSKIEGTVIQGLQGTANLNPNATELLSLIHRFGGRDAVALESAVHELEDDDARAPDRLAAKHRLKTFLFKVGGKVEQSVLNALQAYIEGKLS